jgi:hypothetical protein
MVQQIEIVLRAASSPDFTLVESINSLVDELDILLLKDGFDPLS